MDEEDPVELEAKQAGLSYVSARRQHRLPGQRRRPRDGARWTSSSTTAASPANFLDVGGGATQGAGDRGVPASSCRSPKVKAIFVNIFGGIMKCDIDRRRRRRRGQGARPQGAARRAPRRHQRRARHARSSPRAGSPSSRPTHHGATARRRSSPPCRRGALSTMSILVDKDTSVVVQGITGESGSFHAKQLHRVRHARSSAASRPAGRREVRGQGARSSTPSTRR